MQLYAYDEQKNLIFAGRAHKKVPYYCLECGSIVHRRGGVFRQNHFYHVEPARSCRQSGKGMAHLQIQCSLQNLLPEGDCKLEHVFFGINRIADVVWLSEKMVFEIQCSSISAKEVADRNRDYASAGYEVVWVLHDKRFNQQRLSAAELFLQKSTHYFSNMDEDGRGCIYDQWDYCHKGLRLGKLGSLPVDISRPARLGALPKTALSNLHLVSDRRKSWPLHFNSDLIDLCCKRDLDEVAALYLAEAQRRQDKFDAIYHLHALPAPFWKRIMRFSMNTTLKPYRMMFQFLLEKACR